MSMIGTFLTVLSHLVRIKTVLSVSIWAWLKTLLYCFLHLVRMKRVQSVRKRAWLDPLFYFFSSERMMRVQSMGNRAMNMIGIFFAVFSRLLRMRWVLSVSLWAWLEPVFYCFMRMRRVPNVSKNQRMIGTGKKKKILISWGWGEFQVWART